MTQGFSGDLARQAREAAPKPEVETAREENLLAREGEKLWRRYARREQGSRLAMKVKQALFRKGFGYDEVAAWVERYQEEQEEN